MANAPIQMDTAENSDPTYQPTTRVRQPLPSQRSEQTYSVQRAMATDQLQQKSRKTKHG